MSQYGHIHIWVDDGKEQKLNRGKIQSDYTFVSSFTAGSSRAWGCSTLRSSPTTETERYPHENKQPPHKVLVWCRYSIGTDTVATAQCYSLVLVRWLLIFHVDISLFQWLEKNVLYYSPMPLKTLQWRNSQMYSHSESFLCWVSVPFHHQPRYERGHTDSPIRASYLECSIAQTALQ